MTRWRLFAPLAAVMLVLTMSGCEYLQGAVDAQNANGPVPWWCTSTEEIPVTSGPAVGSVDYYAGTHKAPLSCDRLQDGVGPVRPGQATTPSSGRPRAWPRPPVGGWPRRTSPAWAPTTSAVASRRRCSASPTFDRNNPILDSAGLDDKFDPTKPEVLQFDGNGPTAKLVGFDYYVRTSTGQPPAGFPGNNDWWHIHPKICFRTSDAYMVGVQHDRRRLHVARRHQREHGELLHAPRVGARRHEVHARRLRRDDPVHLRRHRHPRRRRLVPHLARGQLGASAGHDMSNMDMSGMDHDMSGMSGMEGMDMGGSTEDLTTSGRGPDHRFAAGPPAVADLRRGRPWPSVMAAIVRSTSSGPVCQLTTEIRMAARSCQRVPLIQATPPSCTAAMTAGRALVVAEAEQHLVEPRLEHLDAVDVGQSLGVGGGRIAAAVDERLEAVTAEGAQRGVDDGATRPAGELGRPVDGVSAIVVALLEVGRTGAHGPAMAVRVGADGDAAVVGDVEPLVRVGGPRVGPLGTGRQCARACGWPGPRARRRRRRAARRRPAR